MGNGKSTSNKSSLIACGLVSLLLVVFLGRIFYRELKGGQLELGLLLFISFWFLIFALCLKWYIKILKKKKIKNNKELMKKISAKIISFRPWDIDKKSQRVITYYFTASDGMENYDSEEFSANVVGPGDLVESLNLMQIPYNIDNPKNTIVNLDGRLNTIKVQSEHSNFFKRKLLKSAYDATENVKESMGNGEVPYMEFKGHKIHIGDKVNVYIDPENQKNYWIDTDFLYQ